MPRRKPPNAGKGRPKGSKNKRTIRKEMEEAALRDLIKQELEPLAKAQIANARGIKYLVVRERKGGKFVRVHEAMARGAKKGKLGVNEEIIEVWEKDPSVHAWDSLLNRAFGKPKEPEQKVEHGGEVVLRWKERE